ncbi:MAG: GTP-binding protein [Verrucomicrobiales bacterium]|nr:GTP-binding protein [Verrucomicrobiales bacterium]
MDRLQKKVVLLGTPGVGKTSLVRRFVQSLFDEKYLTTIGVKVDKKSVRVGAAEVQLMIWDVAGPENRFSVPSSYIRGAAGCLLVIDGTRPETLEGGLDIVHQIEREIGSMPLVLALNKSDLVPEWRVQDSDLAAFHRLGCAIVRTSAKNGCGVEEAFLKLAAATIP